LVEDCQILDITIHEHEEIAEKFWILMYVLVHFLF
jgi:hypothetical protein